MYMCSYPVTSHLFANILLLDKGVEGMKLGGGTYFSKLNTRNKINFPLPGWQRMVKLKG